MNEKQAGRDFIRNHQIGGKEDGITPEAAAEQGLISYSEAARISEVPPEEEPAIVRPSEETLEHWNDQNVVAREVNGEKRLYAYGAKNEFFAYIVCTSDRIDRNMELLYEEATDVLHKARQKPAQEPTEGLDLVA